MMFDDEVAQWRQRAADLVTLARITDVQLNYAQDALFQARKLVRASRLRLRRGERIQLFLTSCGAQPYSTYSTGDMHEGDTRSARREQLVDERGAI